MMKQNIRNKLVFSLPYSLQASIILASKKVEVRAILLVCLPFGAGILAPEPSAETVSYSYPTSSQKSRVLGKGKTMIGLLYAVAMVFFALWVVGFLFVHVGGGLIHLLLVLAVIAIVYNLLMGRRAV